MDDSDEDETESEDDRERSKIDCDSSANDSDDENIAGFDQIQFSDDESSGDIDVSIAVGGERAHTRYLLVL